MPRKGFAASRLPDGGPWHAACDYALCPADLRSRSKRNPESVSPWRGAMTPLLPADCGLSPTVLSATIPSFRQPRAHCRAAVQDAPALPGYKVLGVLGRGGMATVYKVRQLGTKRLVAVQGGDHSLAGGRGNVAPVWHGQAPSAPPPPPHPHPRHHG